VVPVVGAFLWLDRYEAEPIGLLLFTFAWGAGVATFGALVLNTASTIAIKHAGGDPSAAAVVVAPFVEETLKGLAIVVVFAVRRHEFDGVIDGIVYAGLAATGFAFVENVLYLGRTMAHDGGQGLVFVFVLRCVVSPFAHPLFTSATGIGLGMAARSRSWSGRLLWPIGGWTIAVVLHGLFNAGASVGMRGFTTEYVLFQMPVFVAFVTLAVVARQREGRLIARNLAVYGASGWLTQAEVAMLASLSSRRAARIWARRTGGESAFGAMKVFQELGTELAFLRERLVRGSADRHALEREIAVLEALGSCRELYLPRARLG
jgi:RsiW-degrading membrane proteinase PrsW (M82 family)